MGPIGVQEMIAIFLIALLLFGPKKLPELGRTLGKALTEFRRAKNELKSTFESHMAELERETRVDSEPKYLSSSSSPNYSGYSDTSYSQNSYTGAYDENGLSEPLVESSVSAPPPAVEGSVPRSTGHQALTSSSPLPKEEEHPA